MRFGVIKRLEQHGSLSRYYYVRTSEGDRRSWKSTGQETMALAKEQVRTWQLREAQGERYTLAVSMQDAISQWLAQRCARVAPSTRCYYQRFADEWQATWGPTPVSAVTTADLDRYFSGLSATGARTLNLRLSLLRTYFKWAVDEGYCRRSPASRIPFWREGEKAITALTTEDEKRLLDSARLEGDEWYGYVLCLLSTGFRRGTVATLEWTHIDWSRGEWRIPAQYMKSRRPYTGRPVESVLLQWLTSHRKAGGRVFAPATSSDDVWARIVKRALLPLVTRHDLRRSFITRCRRNGMDLETTKWFSDHRDIAVVADCYRQVNADDARRALDAARQ